MSFQSDVSYLIRFVNILAFILILIKSQSLNDTICGSAWCFELIEGIISSIFIYVGGVIKPLT